MITSLLDRMTPEARARAQAMEGRALADRLAKAIRPLLGKLANLETRGAVMDAVRSEINKWIREPNWQPIVIGSEGLSVPHLELVHARLKGSTDTFYDLVMVPPIAPGAIDGASLAVMLIGPSGFVMTFRAAGAWLVGLRPSGKFAVV